MAVSRISTSSVLQGFPKSRSLLAGNSAYMPGDYDSIATVTVGAGGSSSVSFTSIPADYTHLQIRGIATLSSANNIKLRMNSDTGNNYSWHYLFGSGSAASSGAGSSVSSIVGSYSPTTSNVFGGIVWDILDYKNTNKYKTTRLLTGMDTNGGGNVQLISGLWQSTSAITSLEITGFSGETISQYSQFALYGIKAGA